jgi:hypothetical protein
MKLLLYFATFASVFALFASVIAGTLWVLTKFIQAWGRFFRALIVPPNIPHRRKDVPIGLHPHDRKGPVNNRIHGPSMSALGH